MTYNEQLRRELYVNILNNSFDIAEADETLDRLLALAQEAITTLDIDAEPPVSDVFAAQPNYARDMEQSAAGSIASASALDVMDRWIDGDDDDRRAIDRDLDRQREELERLQHEWTFGR